VVGGDIGGEHCWQIDKMNSVYDVADVSVRAGAVREWEECLNKKKERTAVQGTDEGKGI